MRELLIKKRVTKIKENCETSSVRRYVRKTVYHKACVRFAGKPFTPKRVFDVERNCGSSSVCATARKTVISQACVKIEGEPLCYKRVPEGEVQKRVSSRQVEKESRSEQSACLSRRMRRFVTSVCWFERKAVRA